MNATALVVFYLLIYPHCSGLNMCQGGMVTIPVATESECKAEAALINAANTHTAYCVKGLR